MKFSYWGDSTLWRLRNETQMLKNLWNLLFKNSNAYSFAGILCRHFRRLRGNVPVLKTCCGCWSVRLGAAILGASETVNCGQQTRDIVRIPDVKLAVSWYVTLSGLLNKGGCLQETWRLHVQKCTVKTGGSSKTLVFTYGVTHHQTVLE